MEDKALLAATTVFVLLILLSKLRSFQTTKPTLNLPPGPWTLPVIGSLHHLVTSPNIYRAMRALAQKHGPLMTLRLGEVQAMVVSSPEAAKEVTKTHDIQFADRYVNPTLSALTYDANDIVFSLYGERWRELRKICVIELLSTTRVLSFRRIREDEVSRLMGKVAASAGDGAAVNLSKMISRFVGDVFVRESVGSHCKHQDEYQDAISTALRQTSVLTLADLFPSSRLMQVLGTAPRKVLSCRDKIQSILEQIIHEKAEDIDCDGEAAAAGNEGFVGVLLRLQKERSTTVQLNNDTIVAVLFDLFAAGTETSSNTLNWCMTELARSPAVMAKAQAEVREAFNGKNTIAENDLEQLSYLKLVIKEALRLHTPIPLLVPRMCRETCQIMGYDIPKGMVVFINTWAICRDPEYWNDPEEFKPERFENTNMDYKGTNYEFIPFGAGRRSCPGINLGVGNIELALASLLYHFDWKLPHGIEPKDVDICEDSGLVASKKTSLIMQPVTRIPPVNA